METLLNVLLKCNPEISVLLRFKCSCPKAKNRRLALSYYKSSNVWCYCDGCRGGKFRLIIGYCVIAFKQDLETSIKPFYGARVADFAVIYPMCELVLLTWWMCGQIYRISDRLWNIRGY